MKLPGTDSRLRPDIRAMENGEFGEIQIVVSDENDYLCKYNGVYVCNG